MRHLASLTCVLVAMALGCANPYTTFYSGMARGEVLALPRAQAPGEPRVVQGSGLDPRSFEADELRLVENGYGRVGASSFNSGSIKTSGALKQARALGADLVVIYSQYTDTVSGVVPLVQQVPNTSTTHHSGTVYGPGGTASYGGTSQTYGTSTVITPMPYSVARFDYGATYWVKLRPPGLGVSLADIPSELSTELGRSSGALVQVVMLDSPARTANILRGDVIIRINGREVTGARSCIESMQAFAGQEVKIVVYRNGEEKTLTAKLNPS